MSDKFLTEGEWKKFSKGRTVKDAKFLKLLGDLDKAKTPEQTLATLAEIGKESDQLRKLAKGDKEFLAYVDSIDKAIAKEEKLAKAQESEQDEDEGEEESPALLTTKMIPLLKHVKKGEQMQVLVANSGKEVAVMMSRRPISPARRKLLSEYLGGVTPKFLPGVCIMEENAYTFVLQTRAAGLAKKVKAALLKQVELRLKVRVRGEDANDVDDDGEPDEGNDGLMAEGEDTNAETGIPQPPPPPPDPLKKQFDQRWPDLEKQVLERLKSGAGDVSKLRAVAEFVREKGEAGNYKAAVNAMDSLAKLLPSGEPATAKPVGEPASAFTERLTKLMPAAKTAIAAGGENAQEIKLKISEAGVFARKKDFDQANALLDKAETLIESATQDKAVPEKGGDENQTEDSGEREGNSDQQRWEQRFAEVEPEYLETLAKRPSDAGKLRAVMEYANGQAEAGQYKKAAAALDRLAGMLTTAATSGTITDEVPSQRLVRQRKFMLGEWSQLPGELRSQLDDLRTTLDEIEADEDSDELVDGIEDELESLLDDIQDLMDTAINKGDSSIFKDLKSQTASHPLIKHLSKAPQFDGGKLLKSVHAALERIEKGMQAA